MSRTTAAFFSVLQPQLQQSKSGESLASRVNSLGCLAAAGIDGREQAYDSIARVPRCLSASYQSSTHARLCVFPHSVPAVQFTGPPGPPSSR